MEKSDISHKFNKTSFSKFLEGFVIMSMEFPGWRLGETMGMQETVCVK